MSHLHESCAASLTLRLRPRVGPGGSHAAAPRCNTRTEGPPRRGYRGRGGRGRSRTSVREGRGVLARYKSALRVTVASSAAPYGYTLTIWTTGAVLSHARGIPDAGEALLLLGGAVAAYSIVGGLAFGGLSEQIVPDPAHAVVWGGLHFVSVALAIAAASLVTHFVADAAAWLLGGFLATAVYLVASAGQLTIALAARQTAARGR